VAVKNKSMIDIFSENTLTDAACTRRCRQKRQTVLSGFCSLRVGNCLLRIGRQTRARTERKNQKSS
jgi:hypothetical protein